MVNKLDIVQCKTSQLLQKKLHIDDSVQDCSISIANPLEIMQVCTNIDNTIQRTIANIHAHLVQGKPGIILCIFPDNETMLQYNIISDWLDAYSKWSLQMVEKLSLQFLVNVYMLSSTQHNETSM